MKNIWKILMVAILALAMFACDNASDSESGDNFTTDEGVYSISGKIADISTAWGGSPAAPAFSILLLTDEQKDDLATVYNTSPDWVKAADAANPVYQLAGYGNLTFPTIMDGTFKCYGTAEYGAVGVNIADSMADYEIVIDLSKITKTDIKMLAGGAEKVLTDADSANLKGYKPYIIAITDNTKDANYPCVADAKTGTDTSWSAVVVAMKSGATFPTTFDAAPEKVEGTVTFIFPGDTTTDETKLILTGIEAWKGFETAYNFYSATSGTFKADAKDFDLDVPFATTATEAHAEWLDKEKPADFADGVSAIKFKIGGDEGWTAIEWGTESTYDWADRK